MRWEASDTLSEHIDGVGHEAFAPMTDMTISILIIVLILLSFFAVNFRDVGLEERYASALGEIEALKRSLEEATARERDRLDERASLTRDVLALSRALAATIDREAAAVAALEKAISLEPMSSPLDAATTTSADAPARLGAQSATYDVAIDAAVAKILSDDLAAGEGFAASINDLSRDILDERRRSAQRIAELERALETATFEVSARLRDIERLEGNILRLDQDARARARIVASQEASIATLTAERDRITAAALSAVGGLDAALIESANLKASLDQRSTDLLKAQALILSMERDIAALEATLKAARAAALESDAAIDALRRELASREAKVAELVSAMAALGSRIEELRARETALATALDEREAILLALTRDKEALSAELASLEEEVRGLRSAHELARRELSAALIERESLERENTALLGNLSAAAASIRSLNQDLDAARSEIERLASSLSAATLERDALRGEVDELRDSVERLSSELLLLSATIASLSSEEASLLADNETLIGQLLDAQAEIRDVLSQVAALQARLDELELKNAEIATLLEAAREENAGLIRERDRLRAVIDRRDFELRQSRDALSIERDARIALEARLQAMEALSGRSDESAAEGLGVCLTENERLRARVDRVQSNFDKYFRSSTETLRRLLARSEACASP